MSDPHNTPQQPEAPDPNQAPKKRTPKQLALLKKPWQQYGYPFLYNLHPKRLFHPKRLQNNGWIKVLCVLVAAIFWYIMTEERRANIETGFDVPVTVQDSTIGDTRRAVGNLTPASVRVVLQGKPHRIRGLNPNAIEAVVDVTGLPEGSFTRKVNIVPPVETKLIGVNPVRVQGFVDTEQTRTLPVNVSVVAPEDNSIPRYTLVPQLAKVSGPSLLVQRVQQLSTSPDPLGVGKQREAKLLAIDHKGEAVDGVRIKPSSVMLSRIDTGPLPITTLKVILHDPPSALDVKQVNVQPSKIRVLGTPQALGTLREVVGTVTYRVGKYDEQVRLRLPAGAHSLDTVVASLEIEERPVPDELRTPNKNPERPSGTSNTSDTQSPTNPTTDQTGQTGQPMQTEPATPSASPTSPTSISIEGLPMAPAPEPADTPPTN